MVPKKAKDVISETAQQLGLSEELVDDLINHYYKTVRKTMSDLDDPVILIHNLGTFKVKKKRLLEAKDKFEKKLASAPVADTFVRFTLRKEAAERIDKLNRLLEALEKEELRKEEVKRKRYGNTNQNLEKQTVDTPGSDQQDVQDGTCGESISEENEDM